MHNGFDLSALSRLSHRQRLSALITGVILIVLLAAVWWGVVYINPSNVFWGTVEQSLATPSVVIESNEVNGQNSAKEFVHMDLGSANKVESLTVLRQGSAQVKAEIIGTRDADYTRYLEITPAASKDAKKPDTSKIVNIWAKSSDARQSSTQASGHVLFAQTVLGIGLPVGSVPLPIGNVSQSQRNDLVNAIRGENVYQPSFNTVKKSIKNGRILYTFTVQIQLIPYVRMMQLFAKDVGLHELDQVDPNSYQAAKPLSIKLTIDAISRQLVQVNAGPTGYNQSYAAYGLPLQANVPASYINIDELQKRLAAL